MADQNQPTGTYTPTNGTISGVSTDPVHSPRAARLFPLPPDTTGGPMQGASQVPYTPGGQGNATCPAVKEDATQRKSRVQQ